MAKKESNKKKNVKKGKKNNNKKIKDAYSIRFGPRLQTWLVWLSMFGLGVAFLTFGNIKFFDMQRVETVNSVPVWTQEITETVTTSFISDSNNLKDSGGFLNYAFNSADRFNPLINYNSDFNYYGDVSFDANYVTTLNVFLMVHGGDGFYFSQFEPEGSNLDRSSSFFKYYIEKGSNLMLSVSSYGSTTLTSFDLEPGVIHSVPYSLIDYSSRGFSIVSIRLEKINTLNDDLDDNMFRLYPAVDLTFRGSGYTYNFKSYENFRIDEKITKKSEMVLNYEDRYSYHYEYKLNMSMDEFAAIGTSLFDNVVGYFGKLLDIWETVYGFLVDLYNFIVDGFLGLLRSIGDGIINLAENIGNIGDNIGNIWDKIKDLVNINSNVIIDIYSNNNSVVLRRWKNVF